MYMLTEVIKPPDSTKDPDVVFMYDLACILETNIKVPVLDCIKNIGYFLSITAYAPFQKLS